METIVRDELLTNKGRARLSFQNHLYGCFLFMEDVAEKKVTLENGVVQPFGWNLDEEFGKIGMRYGFVVDSQLVLVGESEYKKAWMERLLRLSSSMVREETMAEVDALEDALIRMIREVVPPEEAFFIKALETGALSQEWMEKVVRLLSGLPAVPVPIPVPMVLPTVLPMVPSTPIVHPTLLKKHLDNPRRLFATTRRQLTDKKKGALAITRRQIVKT